ncbi:MULTISPECIES: primosomal protein N' [Cyanophyceae]|uniref:Replication restart protein PriA n=1 Tax=Leptolyngbya subtilissima DQ-A4 TaxID=2933933 RepID=A0ABV0K027_9CYAN|nr:primosomal protein N' [Nodosilinea sp. FACHB-141]MBD2110914.1 primosomal protein N' [Nodosilinea sp. FACHB-141]
MGLGESGPQPQWVNVLVDYGGQPAEYTYAVPASLEVQVGDILTVPFRHQSIGAIALSLSLTPPANLVAHQIRSVEGVVEQRFFAPPYWVLLQRVAHYYQVPLMQVLKTALPPGLLAKSQRRLRLQRDRLPQLPLAPGLKELVEDLQRSPTGDYTWPYLQKRGHSYRTLQQLIQSGWAESYLAPPQPPQAKRRQAITLVCGDILPPNLTARQQEIIATLRRQGGDLWLSDALQLCQTTSPTLKRLAQIGCLVIEPREQLRAETGPVLLPDQPKPLTHYQAQVLAPLNKSQQGSQFLLHGVTGSGKTEVYLQAIAPRLAAGQSALVLVPEIGLTPQLTDRFRRRFGDQVWVYHSNLADGERYDTWRQSLRPSKPLVIVGTRSAIFMPLPNLGLIILDEEHDSSYKQDVPPCYHARTVARWRAELENCPLVLGSATPSLDTWVQCQGLGEEMFDAAILIDREMAVSQTKTLDDRQIPTLAGVETSIASSFGGLGERPALASSQTMRAANSQPKESLPWTYLSLPERVQAQPLPTVNVVDMRDELQDGNRSILSRSLQTALATMKAEGNQGLLFIHRRGHSSFVSCRSCGYVMMCPHCDVSLSYHQPGANSAMTLRCHYCNYSQNHPKHCPACSSPYLKHFGSGTQRVVNALAETFPELSCIRFDSDTTRTKGAHRALLTRFAEGGADLLVGTQMLTKGIDLPQVTLVGIIAADGLLYMNDYWASERALQMLIQVAGRAGRGTQPGQVFLQTYTPDHPVVEAVTRHAYEGFIVAEWAQRQLLQYPPAGQMVLLRLSSTDPDAVQQTADILAQQVTQMLAGSSYQLLGPAPAPIPRVARRYRWHLVVKGPLNEPLPNLQDLKRHCPSQVSLTIDVDPLNLA